MFTSIRIEGLGPHEDATLDLDPAGLTEIVGPSEAGKSTVIDALSLALWGTTGFGKPVPAEAIRDGAKGCTVTLTSRSGTTLQVRRTRKGATTREKSGESYSSAAAWAKALGPLGKDAARIAAVPRAWLDLAAGPGGGRPLRDLIAGLSGEGSDLRGEVARLMAPAELRRTDPLDEQAAASNRAGANKARDEARGALRALDVPDEAPALPPDTTEAEATVKAAGLWAAYDVAIEEHRRAAEAVEAASAAHADWCRRRDALGKRPEVDEDAARQARDGVAQARARVEDARAVLARAEAEVEFLTGAPDRELEAARAEVAGLEAAGDTCPTCDRPGWSAAAAKLEQARARLAEIEERRGVALRTARGKAADSRGTLGALEIRLTEAEAAVPDTSAAAEWDRAAAALGQAPVVGHAPRPPQAPKVERPHADAVDAARDLLDLAREARAAVAAHERAAAARATRVAEAEQALATAEAEAARLDALVSAVRRAPTEIARRQLAALGDLGPVGIEFTEKGGAEVLVDGRPWWCASSGRQVVADLWLRAGIRRALGAAAWLPLVVDDASLWSGEWPETGGPVVMLRTAAVDGLIVRSLASEDERGAA